jgi:hypothetical protein
MNLFDTMTPEQRERCEGMYKLLPAHFRERIDRDMAEAEAAFERGELEAVYAIADRYGFGAVVRDYVAGLASGQHEQRA